MAVFEKFTDEGRQVVVYAQEEARLLNHHSEPKSVGAQILVKLGGDLNVVGQQVADLLAN